MQNVKVNIGSRVGIGTVIAIILSWTANHSIFWCIIHGIFGWFYVLYRIGGCGGAPQ